METQSKKKPGRNKQKSPPYQQTEQLVRTALNQGMLAKEIAVLCRVDASIINKWKNGLVKAQTHVITPLVERFGHAVNRHQLHHFSHVDPDNSNQQKLTEIRGTLIFNWDIKEIYDVDERSLDSMHNCEYQTPRFRDFVTSKVHLFHRKPDKYIVAVCSRHTSGSTFQEEGREYHSATKQLQAHISNPQPEFLEVSSFSSVHEALTILNDVIAAIIIKPANWLENRQQVYHTPSIGFAFGSGLRMVEKNQLLSKVDLSKYKSEIGNYYKRQFQDAERTLFRQCRLHGFIESDEFLGKVIEVI